MGEQFNKRLEEISKMKTYSKQKQRALDDMATAYLQDGKPLDQGLFIVNSIKKALRANGYNQQQIEDYLIEYSYCSKTRIRRLYNESIYNEDCSIKKVVECIPAFYTDKSLTDSIIDELKSRPVLLADIKKGMRADNLQRKHKINNTTLLINFYDKHKAIIELD